MLPEQKYSNGCEKFVFGILIFIACQNAQALDAKSCAEAYDSAKQSSGKYWLGEVWPKINKFGKKDIEEALITVANGKPTVTYSDGRPPEYNTPYGVYYNCLVVVRAIELKMEISGTLTRIAAKQDPQLAALPTITRLTTPATGSESRVAASPDLLTPGISPRTGSGSMGDGRSSCIKLEPKGKGASVKNVCSERLTVSVCVANAKHWWPCGQSGGLINLRPEASYPVQDLSLWPGQVRWAACIPPATPQDWDGSEGGSFSCR